MSILSYRNEVNTDCTPSTTRKRIGVAECNSQKYRKMMPENSEIYELRKKIQNLMINGVELEL